jgi:hypothetical protein
MEVTRNVQMRLPQEQSAHDKLSSWTKGKRSSNTERNTQMCLTQRSPRCST